MTTLRISPDLALPLEAVTQTFAILAKRRVGKTYTASVIAEEFVHAKLPFVALDPTGAWWGLRASADGERAGLPVVIIGGPHGDLPLEPTAGKVIADLVVDHPGHYVIDLSQTESDAAQDRFATDFALRLYRRKADRPFPLHLFVDEADSFAPQKPQDGQQRMLGAFEALIRRGGIRGIGMTMITQRPAVLNKNVLTQAETLIVLRVIAPQDQDAIDAWVKRNGTAEQRAEFMGSLASLGRGEAWVWSPSWLEVFAKVHIRERRTFNSSATPEVGTAAVEPRVLAPVDLEALRGKIAETIEKAKADDPKVLRARIAELERELAQARTAGAERPVDRVVADPAAIEAALGEYAGIIATRHAAALAEFRAWVHAAASAAADELVAELARIPDPDAIVYPSDRPLLAQRVVAGAATLPAGGDPLPDAPRRVGVAAPARAEGAARVSGPQQRMLDALASFRALGITKLARSHVAVFSDQSPRSSGFEKNMSTLRTLGLIDYPEPGVLALTEAGRAAANPAAPVATLAELHQAWYAKVSGPQQRMLEELIHAYPRAMDRELLAKRTTQSPRSSGWEKNLSTLRSLGLIDYPSTTTAIATNLLFPEGLK